MTGLARSCRHISSTRARAAAGSVSARSSSISLPWRTSPISAKPRPFNALPIALPCGSRTPGFRLIWTRAFIAKLLPWPLLQRFRRLEVAGAAFGQDAEAARHFLVALLDPAEILAEPVLVHLLVGARVPQPAIVRADLVGNHDAHLVVAVKPAEFQLEIDQADVDAEKQPGQEVVDPQRDLHDFVEILGAGPAEGGDVFLGNQWIAQFVLLQIIFDDRARQHRALGYPEALRQRAGGGVADDDRDRDDLDLAHQLLAHVEPAHEMGRDPDLGQPGHQEFADPVVEDALAGDRAALLIVEGAGVVLEILDEGAGFGALEQQLGLAFVDLPTPRHYRFR